jgi:hypothetical protein
MRYYVLCRSEVEGILPYIVAEVVHEVLELDDQRATSLAATIAGPRSTVATRQELMSQADTRAALRDWDGQDDAEFDRETVLLNAAEPMPTNVIPLRRSGPGTRRMGM